MPTFIYSPGVKVLIDTLDAGIIDVTEDVTSGSLTLTENMASTFDFNLLNHRRKYDGLFSPNDIVTVKLKRINWLPVFAGYLNQVPYFSVYPRTVHLTAMDTLKRLKMQVWDSGSSASAALMATASGNSGVGQVDGGLRDKIIVLLTEVAGWDLNKIHIGQIPNNWYERLQPLKERLAEQISIQTGVLGTSGVIQGVSAASRGTVTVQGSGPGTGQLPIERGRAGVIKANEPFELTAPERSGPGARGTATGPRDDWYIAMRWPYRLDSATSKNTGSDVVLTATQARDARQWWKDRRILVINPKNDKGVVVRAVDWGPPSGSPYVALLSDYALKTNLGAKEGDSLEFRFANADLKLGPVPTAQRVTVPAGSVLTGEDSALSPVITGETGRAWKASDNLQPQTSAARSFVKSNWNTGYGIGGYVQKNIAGTTTRSDHATGHAIDVHVTRLGNVAKGQELAMGNAIAKWFAANPDVFGIKYIIWMDRKNSGNGWRPYRHPGGVYTNTLQHRDHVHISFKAGVQTEAGPMGNSWPGSSDADFNNFVATGNGATFDPGGSGFGIYDIFSGLVGPDGLPLLNAFQWTPIPGGLSDMLAGARALLNDKPILQSVAQLVQASQRSFMAAPNGDFISWFPDYFGVYGTAAKMVIRDIELANEGFTVAWDDERLITHQFVAGALTGVNFLQPGGEVSLTNKLNTMGIATVEFPELMEALFNVGPGNPRAKYFRDAQAILQRFGARVDYREIDVITGPDAEFWYACALFQRAWASQFSSNVNLTFMPEVWPGMLLELQTFKFQAYVEQVVHQFDLGEGGGFTTSVRVIAPSTTDRSGFYGLPLGGAAANQPARGATTIPVGLPGAPVRRI